MEDYYQEDGFTVMMLITGQIRQKLLSAVKKTGRTTLSVFDLLTAARRMKISLHGKTWRVDNKRKKNLELFKLMAFEPDFKLDA